jgi:uncharacterized coiled-coil protein SlyX
VGFDRTNDAEAPSSAADRLVHAVPSPGREGEIREQPPAGAELSHSAEDNKSRAAAEATGGKLTAEERVAESLRAHATADAVYAGSGHGTARADETTAKPAHAPTADGDQQDRSTGDAAREQPDAGSAAGREASARSPDTAAAAEEVLRRRVSELEDGKAVDARRLAGYETRLAEQDRTIAELSKIIAGQGQSIARLEAGLDRVTGALDEVREKQEQSPPSAQIEQRFRGKDAEQPEWKEEQHKRRLPTDAVNSVVSAAVGSALTALPYQVHDFPPEVAGLAAGGVALGAGIIAVWRERRKADDDDSHRPDN